MLIVTCYFTIFTFYQHVIVAFCPLLFIFNKNNIGIKRFEIVDVDSNVPRRAE